MRKEEKIKVGISIGDLNGIGGEIVLKTLEDSRILIYVLLLYLHHQRLYLF